MRLLRAQRLQAGRRGQRSPQARFWHYTKGCHLPQILESEVIRVADILLDPRERPVVWFSPHPLWEPTVTSLWADLPIEEIAVRAGGLVRIEVRAEAAPVSWRSWRKHSGVSWKTATRLGDTARKQGANPNGWRVSYQPVTSEMWLAVETWNNGVWQPLPQGAQTPARARRGSSDGREGSEHE